MMELRSNSCREEKQSYCGGRVAPTSMKDLRCYSATHADLSAYYPHQIGNEVNMKKGKSIVGELSRSWSFNDAELQRKKRVAGYKIYAAEGKMKGSLKKSFRWIKNTYIQAVYGRW